MRRILFLLLFVMSMISASAVNYHSVGSNAEFCVYTFDGEFYLILSFEDDDENHLSNNTIVKFMLNDGTVIRLEGTDGSKSTSQSSIHWGFGVFSGSSSLYLRRISSRDNFSLRASLDSMLKPDRILSVSSIARSIDFASRKKSSCKTVSIFKTIE